MFKYLALSIGLNKKEAKMISDDDKRDKDDELDDLDDDELRDDE